MTDNWDFSHFQQDCYDISKAKGFHDKSPTDHLVPLMLARSLLLIVSEACEAFEYLRCGGHHNEIEYVENQFGVLSTKPEGVPVELADIVIRVFDLAAEQGIDLTAAINAKMAYNRSRPRLHGKAF